MQPINKSPATGVAVAAAAPSRTGQALAAATAFFSLFSIVGLALYGLPFFYDFMVRDNGWTRAQVTSGNALSKLIVGPAFGFIAGWIVDRFGPRRLMLAGILMGGFALTGLSVATTMPLFYFFYLFNALGYVCGGPLPNQVLLSRWFDRARGKAMGFAYLGIGVGGAAAPLVANWLTSHLGWPGALRVLGILMIAIAFPFAFFVRESPPGAAAPIVREEGAAIGPVLKTRAFYLLAIGSMCSIAAVGGTMQNLKLFLSLDVRLAQGDIARLLSLVLVVSLAGRLLMGWLADRFPKKKVMLGIYLAVAAGIPLLFFADSRAALYLFAAIFGIGLGGDYMIIPLMAAELFGVRLLGRVMGIVLTADGVAEATAPLLVAATRDATHSYAGGFMILIGFAAMGAVAVALLPGKERQPRRHEDTKKN
jgi:MFS family permease